MPTVTGKNLKIVL